MKQAIQKLKNLPEEQQDFYAQEILDTLTGDDRWATLFADPRSEQVLSEMAKKARAEHEAGKTVSMEDFLKSASQ